MILLALSLVAAIADGDTAMSTGDYDAAAQYYRAEAELIPNRMRPSSSLRGPSLFRNTVMKQFSFTRNSWQRDRIIPICFSREGGRMRGRTAGRRPRTDLTAVTKRSPGYGDAWSALGDMYLWSDRPSDAVNAYGKWIAAEPGDPRAYIARARAHRSAGDLDAAGADFEAARAHGAPDSEIDQYLALPAATQTGAGISSA